MRNLVLALMIGLTGCVTHPVFNPYQVTPKKVAKPLVFEQMSFQRSVFRPVTSLTLTAPSPLKPVYLFWDYPEADMVNVEYFKVYHSQDLLKHWQSWDLYGTTPGLSMMVMPTNRMDFFYCTAYGFGVESMPNK